MALQASLGSFSDATGFLDSSITGWDQHQSQFFLMGLILVDLPSSFTGPLGVGIPSRSLGLGISSSVEAVISPWMKEGVEIFW